MIPVVSFSESFDQALILATLAHDRQPRKGTFIPYIMHPVHVARLLERHGYSEEVVIAGLLHDVLEEAKFADLSLQDRLRQSFGEFETTLELPVGRRVFDIWVVIQSADRRRRKIE